eukprot:TRINITY_DN36231_c0_g1_i1.p1 TRINITY_DN36231_c0_g1~~TRINITY_DN36231_c0_g1_i1.p1  ORF type:complete len:1967 (-),score=360.22 TRINITY_DN36231_c0_g1_i1:270-5858(-)
MIASIAHWKEGALFVHAKEPLFGDPLVLLKAADLRLDAPTGGGCGEGDSRILARLLCSGRTAEVRASCVAPLELRPATSNLAALAAFEEVFLFGGPEDIGDARNRSVFGTVELAELDSAQLEAELEDCWPVDAPSPVRGLAWALRPFFADWLKRRQRLENFTQLVVALPIESLQRLSAPTRQGAPPLESLLLDVTERDLLIAMLLTTPPEQRSRLYDRAVAAGSPLPLAFPALRCPCPPYEDPSTLDGASVAGVAVDRGLCVHWDAFESLLARPSGRPLLMSLGAHGCLQGGKSALLKELLGLQPAIVESVAPIRFGDTGTPVLPSCNSPVHTPGVDLLRSPPPLGWTADVHGCALGDPSFMSLIASLASTAALVVLHVSADDFQVEYEEERVVAPQPAAAPKSGVRQRATLRTGFGSSTPSTGAPSATPVIERVEPGPPIVSMKPDLLALLRICVDARLPGVGTQKMRVLVLYRDAGPQHPKQYYVLSQQQQLIENVLGTCFAGVCMIERLTGLTGGYKQRALANARGHFHRELSSISGTTPGFGFGGTSSSPTQMQMPCLETLKRIYAHFYDRMTLAGERAVLVSSEFSIHSRMGERISALMDEIETHAGGRLCATIFPITESSLQQTRLKAQEKRLLEGDGGVVDDAQIAELSAKLRALERRRRTLLSEPLSAPVRFFVQMVLSDNQLHHGKVEEFGQYLNAWRTPRMTPLVERRRNLLDKRLEVAQDRNLQEEVKQKQMDSLSTMLKDAEFAMEQLEVSLDGFWGELAAVTDLSAEMQTLGVRPPPELPDATHLKRMFGDWAWSLNLPVQLLHGAPLQSAGQFLVDVLRDLGAHDNRELFVISVIGIQSSAKSTLLNYLFGCGFATSAGRCTKGLYCSLMEAHGRTLLLLDTEGLMSLEADGGDVFDAQLALMAMACSHLVLINHKGELSRQLQDLLEVCLFAMQHLKVTKLQPKLLFVLRDQHDRSHGVHNDALRLMRKHLSEASSHLQLRLDDLISLDPGSVFLLPSAFATDLEPNTHREVQWSTTLFASEALRLRHKIFQCHGGLERNSEGEADGGSPEFSTLPDWCLHAMSVWHVLDRYGPNLLHYKTIQEIEVQRELEEMVKSIAANLVQGSGGLAEQTRALLAECSQRLTDRESSEQVDAEFKSSLQALLDSAGKRAQTELEQVLNARKTKLPDAQKSEAKKKLQTPVEYQGELTRYTWALSLTEAVDRDQLRALKVHFKKTIEDLWQTHSSQALAEEQARQIFASEWFSFEEKCKERFEQTARSKKQLAEEVCLIFNHVLRQHRHSDETLHVVDLVPATVLLNQEPMSAWDNARIARTFLEVRFPQRLAEFADPRRGGVPVQRGAHGPPPVGPAAQVEACVVPEIKKNLAPLYTFEIPEGSTQVPGEETLLEAIRKLNEAVMTAEKRFLGQTGVRFQGGCVAFLNATNLCLRHSVLSGLERAETRRAEHQWRTLQSHRQRTEEEFISMVQRHTSDAGRAKMLADLFFDALAREWLDETLVTVAADIRAQCLADMPDASGAAERAYQQSFVERNWTEVLEYVIDVNAYLHKIFSSLFEDRKASITRAQGPQIARQLGVLFDSLTGVVQRWSTRQRGRRTKLSSLQAMLQELAAESRASVAAGKQNQPPPWPLLSERFPVVADFDVEDPARFAHELGLQVASRLGQTKVEGVVAERLEAALLKQQAQVWALIRGCSAMCPCCGSKCDRMDNHTVHNCSHHLLPAFNGWRVAGTCEAALDACKSSKNHEAPKRSDFSDHLFPNLEDYLKAEHPEWLPFPKEDRELLADSVLKAAWVNCRAPLLFRFDMVDSTPAEWIAAYEEPHRKLKAEAIDEAEFRLEKYGYDPDPKEDGVD